MASCRPVSLLFARAFLCGLAVFYVAIPIPAQTPPGDLSSMNIEDLMKVEVTSVSKHEQTLSQAAAAIFVISQEDIRNSGATNIPDLLRMVPGIYVAQINANTWAICARAFNGRFSNELLVMVDGRTVYTPTFGGVLWDTLDFPLFDIERIEVIRGPGGSVWGPNAVNGVINIITKKTADTLGTTLKVVGGNIDKPMATVEHGGHIGEAVTYRLFTKYLNSVGFPNLDGHQGLDGWHQLRAGFRSDMKLSSKDSLSVQGDIYSAREGLQSLAKLSWVPPQPVRVVSEENVSGGFIHSTWNHTFSPKSDTTLAASYQRYDRTELVDENSATFDLDFQHNLTVGERQQIVWGLAYRHTASHAEGSQLVTFSPADRSLNLFSGFFQYQVALAANRVHLTLGTKLQHHYYTGFAAMPTARVAWTPNDNHTIWAAVSRAVRTPSDTDVSVRYNASLFSAPDGTLEVVRLYGNPNFKNEDVISFEVGYRALLYKNLSLDVAIYFNDYDDQQSTEPRAPFFESSPAPAHLVIPLTYANLLRATARGLEIYSHWKIANWWTLSPGFSYQHIHRRLDAASRDTSSVSASGEDTPEYSPQLRSHVALPHNFAWDTSVAFNSRLDSPQVPSYTRLDTGLTWQWKTRFSISAFGQNLIQSRHFEFFAEQGTSTASYVPRGGYVKITWHF